MTPLEHTPENVGLLAGIVGALTGVFFAVVGHSRTRIGEIAVSAVEESEKFVLAARQEEVNRNLQGDVADIKSTVSDIHHLLISAGTRSNDRHE